GDQIKEGDVLADIETDKATMQMKSYDDGTIVHIDHDAGEEVALGQRVMVLAKKNEDPQKVAAALGGGAQAKAPAQKAASTGATERAEAAAPVAASAAAGGVATGGNGSNGQPATTAVHENGGRVKASPLAKKLAESAKISLGQVRGSGPNGRIVRRDVEDF